METTTITGEKMIIPEGTERAIKIYIEETLKLKDKADTIDGIIGICSILGYNYKSLLK